MVFVTRSRVTVHSLNSFSDQFSSPLSINISDQLHTATHCTGMQAIGLDSLVCHHPNCGRSFSTTAALNYHRRSCPAGRKRLQSALSKGKELWEAKKRARISERARKEASSSAAEELQQSSTNRGEPSFLSNTNSQSVPNTEVKLKAIFVVVLSILMQTIGGGRRTHPAE